MKSPYNQLSCQSFSFCFSHLLFFSKTLLGLILGSCSSASYIVFTILPGFLLWGFNRTSHTNPGCPKLAAFLILKLFQLPCLSSFPKALVWQHHLCLLKKGFGFQSQCCALCALQFHLCLAPLRSGTQEAEFYCLQWVVPLLGGFWLRLANGKH